MADTNFIAGVTKILASWIQPVNDLVYKVLGNPSTVAQARTNLSVYSKAEVDAKTWDYATQITGKPTWAGRLIKTTLYTYSSTTGSFAGTFTPQSNTEFLVVEVQAPGGAGQLITAGSATGGACGCGGHAGAYGKVLIPFGQNFSSVAVNIGAKGSGAPGGNRAGGNANFGAFIDCRGGLGPTNQGAIPTLPYVLYNASVSVNDVTTANCTVLVSRTTVPGEAGVALSTSVGYAGRGGDSAVSSGALGEAANASGVGAGASAFDYGGGGGGSYSLGTTSVPANSGDGGGGYVLVYEYTN